MSAKAKTKQVKDPIFEAVPQDITPQTFANAMRELKAYKPFQLLQAQWLNIRHEILQGGKAKPSEAAWNVLAGFDRAILVPERWAEYAMAGRKKQKDESYPTQDLDD